MNHTLFYFLLAAIQLIIGYHLVFPLLLYLVHRLTFRQKTALPKSSSPADYAIIVTAYEQTHTLAAVVDSLTKLNYSNYLIYLVADKCDISQLNFTHDRLILLRPPETLASNIKSHFYAIQHFKRQHERLTIIDSDNLVHPEYLNELNKYFDSGFQAVQGVREAKNLNTVYARLDAARDIYYHFYDGKLLFETGSSATLAGSGMAFTTALYRDCLENKEIAGAGFDKVLQAEIVKRDIRIAFAPQAIVYDEKTAKADQLVNQRSRWINTWFKYFAYGFPILLSGIKKLSRNQLLFGMVLLRPPLFIFLSLSGVCLLLNSVLQPAIAVFWLAGFMAFIWGFRIALIQSSADQQIIQSLVSIPKFVFYQFVSLFHVRNANKRSVATKHSYNEGSSIRN